MTKKVNWLPNERVDIPDMNAGTNDLAEGFRQQLDTRIVMDRFPRFVTGFRVSIAPQLTAPGQFTVYNGVAFDRAGTILENQSEENASRSFTLLADGLYYIEVIATSVNSDTDARGFWNPDFDNGTDPSGDVRLPGREFAQNVATRLTPDWQIVTPPSTTGFEISSNPNSLKVPVATIQVTGGVIVSATTNPPRTTLLADASLGATKIYVVDSTLFPDTFSGTIDGAAITITANDRVNGILSLSAGLAAGHNAGVRIIQTSGTPEQFLVDVVATTLPASGTRDARPRMYQGFEEAGAAYSKNPTTVGFTGNSDVNIENLKAYIDFLAAELREIKFGGMRADELGKLGPPTAFTTPRYYDLSGGLLPARAHMVSIGDGQNSWGDFNVAQLGSADIAMTTALNYVNNFGGGIIYVKAGTYEFTASHTIDFPVILYGDGEFVTNLFATGSVPIFTIVENGNLTLHNMTLLNQATAPAVVRGSATTSSQSPSFSAYQCQIDGMDTAGGLGTRFINSTFENCLFTSLMVATQSAVLCDFNQATFTNCTFLGGSAAGSRALQIPGTCVAGSHDSQVIKFTGCSFNGQSANTAIVALGSAGAPHAAKQITFDRCAFQGNDANPNVLSNFGSAVSDITFNGCVGGSGGTFIQFSSVANVVISGCRVTISGTSPGIFYSGTNMVIRDSVFNQTTNFGAGDIGISMSSPISTTIDSCLFNDCDIAVQIASGTRTRINSCRAFSTNTGRGQVGFVFTGTTVSCGVHSCAVDSLSNTSGSLIAGVWVNTGTVAGLFITECSFLNLVSTVVPCYGVNIAQTAGSFNVTGLCISNNRFGVITSTATEGVGISTADNIISSRITGNELDAIGTTAPLAIGIRVAGGTDVVIANNALFAIGGSTPTRTAGVYLSKGSNNATDFVVSNNTMSLTQNAVVDELGGGIVLDDCGIRITVTGNIVHNLTSVLYGVRVRNTTTIQVSDIVVTGNQLNGVWGGVRVDLAGPGAGLSTSSERVTVTGNQIYAFQILGVYVNCTTNALDVVVSGNNIRTDVSLGSQFGISLTNCNNYSLSSNIVSLNADSALDKAAVFLSVCNFGTVGSNDLYVQHMSNTFGVVYLSACIQASVHANMIHLINNASTADGVVGAGCTNCFAMGNSFRLPNGNLRVTPVPPAANGINVRAQDSSAQPNVGTNPSALTTIDLNLSVT